MAFTFKIDTDKAMNKLRKANEKIGKKILSQALRMGAKIVRDKAAQDIPVDSGASKKSLKVRVGKGNRRKGYIRYVVFVAPMKKGSGKKEEDAFYFRFVELGTKYIKARHIMRDAEDKVRKQVEATVQQYVRQAI